jgi:transposase
MSYPERVFPMSYPMPHIQGADRHSDVQFPPTLDEYISDENSVRFIDAFVDQLDLQELGFARVSAAIEGRPGYHPGDLLKLYIYGYLNRIRSSRALERETHRNVELMWLLKQLKPDHKTIADFRRDHSEALRGVCRQFTQLCKDLELFGGELVAIDGSQFLAVNSRRRNFTTEKLQKALKEIDEQIATYLSELEQQDGETASVQVLLTPEQLQRKLERLNERKANPETLAKQLADSGETQISLTDPDSRSMITGARAEVCYNVQTAVDAKHGLIVEHEITNDVSDQAWLAKMAKRAKETLEVDAFDVVADRGYYDGDEVKQCLEADITPYIAKPLTSVNQHRGRFIKQDFRYDAQQDVYHCPGGAQLEFRFDTIEKGRHIRYYKTAACRDCPLKEQCTQNKEGRRITRWVDEHLLEAMDTRVKANPQVMKQRSATVEHPFGTLKRGMNQGYFLCRGFVKVKAEMSLSVLAYNLKRVINILGIDAMIASLTAMKTTNVS